jgi:hypothetical protein
MAATRRSCRPCLVKTLFWTTTPFLFQAVLALHQACLQPEDLSFAECDQPN